MRGGSFGDPNFWLRSAARSGIGPKDKNARHVGFRIVCAPEQWAGDE
jgi:formylglycine-generating enzyme required for sulfatase activity